MNARGDGTFYIGENTRMFECKTYLGGETARAEVRSTRAGAVVTMGMATVLLEVVSRLITGARYIMLTPADPMDTLVTVVVLRKERIEYWRILTSVGQKCLTKLWSSVTISLCDTTSQETTRYKYGNFISTRSEKACFKTLHIYLR